MVAYEYRPIDALAVAMPAGTKLALTRARVDANGALRLGPENVAVLGGGVAQKEEARRRVVDRWKMPNRPTPGSCPGNRRAGAARRQALGDATRRGDSPPRGPGRRTNRDGLPPADSRRSRRSSKPSSPETEAPVEVLDSQVVDRRTRKQAPKEAPDERGSRGGPAGAREAETRGGHRRQRRRPDARAAQTHAGDAGDRFATRARDASTRRGHGADPRVRRGRRSRGDSASDGDAPSDALPPKPRGGPRAWSAASPSRTPPPSARCAPPPSAGRSRARRTSRFMAGSRASRRRGRRRAAGSRWRCPCTTARDSLDAAVPAAMTLKLIDAPSAAAFDAMDEASRARLQLWAVSYLRGFLGKVDAPRAHVRRRRARGGAEGFRAARLPRRGDDGQARRRCDGIDKELKRLKQTNAEANRREETGRSRGQATKAREARRGGGKRRLARESVDGSNPRGARNSGREEYDFYVYANVVYFFVYGFIVGRSIQPSVDVPRVQVAYAVVAVGLHEHVHSLFAPCASITSRSR